MHLRKPGDELLTAVMFSWSMQDEALISFPPMIPWPFIPLNHERRYTHLPEAGRDLQAHLPAANCATSLVSTSKAHTRTRDTD